MPVDMARIQRLERWRGAVRRQEEAATREAWGLYRRSADQLEQAAAQRRQIHHHLVGTVGTGCPGSDIRFMCSMLQGAQAHEGQRAMAAQTAATLLESRRERLVTARQEERILSTLSDRLKEDERLQALAAEQKLIDDLAGRR